jgi:hypothetical protein
MAVFLLAAALLFSAPLGADAVKAKASMALRANPVRKVVTMLQDMDKKIIKEGEKEKEMFEKFMCWCKSSGGDLQKSIADCEAKISALPSDIEAAKEEKTQVEEALKQSQNDRASAKAAMAEATALRAKEAGSFAALKAETEANINAVSKAVASIEKGTGGSFLQTGGAQRLEHLANSRTDMDEDDREAVLSFLSGEQQAPSGEILGILKQMGDEMAASLAEATASEESAIKSFNDLMAAKTKEVNACTIAVESKTQRMGELGIDIVELENDLSEAEKSAAEDKKFLADMGTTCKTREAEWEVVVKTRSEELEALADTIKILNDDDALELFKKTLPSAGSSFIQVQVSSKEMQRSARAVLRRGRHRSRHHKAGFDLITLALTGKKVNFGKVITMIDEMVAVLKGEQADDDKKKVYCETEFDVTEDKKKELDRAISGAETNIQKDKDAIATLKEEIAALEAGIVALDKAVAEATVQRKEENTDFTNLMASDTAAKELIEFAKNRLNKFYNPKLYKPAPKRDLSAEDSIVVSMGGSLAPTAPPGGIAGTGISLMQVSARARAAPAPPPEAVGAFQKKSEESTGVIGMMDIMIADLDKDMTVAQTEEKDAQKDYEAMLADAADKRAMDSEALNDKVSVKATTEADLQAHTDEKNTGMKELMATHEYESALHQECDWLLQNFAVRKEARAGEVDSLAKAKDVLSGADFSLLQRSVRHMTRRHL